MDQDLENKVKCCSSCQSTRHQPAPAPLHPWEWPQRPWARLHADYAGPFCGKMFLIVVDAYSKWLEVRPVSSATSATTMEQLRSIFATHGLPELLVTDNGTVFTSAEFEEFTKLNGIRHIKSALTMCVCVSVVCVCVSCVCVCVVCVCVFVCVCVCVCLESMTSTLLCNHLIRHS